MRQRAAIVIVLTAASCAELPRNTTGLNDDPGGPLAERGLVPPKDWEIPARTSRQPAGPRGSEGREPTNPGAGASMQSLARTRSLAGEAHLRGDFAAATTLWREATKLAPEDGELQFSLARSCARAGDAEGAAAAAREAWKLGKTGVSRYENETDFAPVAKQPAWVGLMAELRARGDK